MVSAERTDCLMGDRLKAIGMHITRYGLANRALHLPPGGVECSLMRLRLRSRSESRRRCDAVVRG